MNALNVAKCWRSASEVDRFKAYYIPHVKCLIDDWRRKHPIRHHCEPLRADLHTNWPITVKEYDWF